MPAELAAYSLFIPVKIRATEVSHESMALEEGGGAQKVYLADHLERELVGQ